MAKGNVQVQNSKVTNKNKRHKDDKPEEPVTKKIKKSVPVKETTSGLSKQKAQGKIHVEDSNLKKNKNKRQREDEPEDLPSKKVKKNGSSEENKPAIAQVAQEKVSMKKQASKNGISEEDVTADSQVKSLFLRKVPTRYTTEQVKALSKDIVHARLKTKKWRKAPGEPKVKLRYAFLDFENRAKAEQNYKKLNGMVIESVTLCLDYVKTKSEPNDGEKNDQPKEAKKAVEAAKTTPVKKATENVKTGKKAVEVAKTGKKAAEVAKTGKKAAEVAKTGKKAAEVAKTGKKAVASAKLKRKQEEEEDDDEEDEEEMDTDDEDAEDDSDDENEDDDDDDDEDDDDENEDDDDDDE